MERSSGRAFGRCGCSTHTAYSAYTEHTDHTDAQVVAHELNNALAPIVGYAELLALDPAVAASPTAARYAALIAEAANDAVRTVARLQRGARRAAPPTITPLGPVLDLSGIPAAGG